ncbi:beta-1,6-N-acetylglucosaminyltransferase [Polaribacter septentrionalilitoris]|uniref:beta-1,6-N-acetylglucosaminyltransferase n=1 Tax=Polaribacter septentrionalilitoris TaxID=2494657 RepID=UPI0013591155|nr:beta-1,6-N-acetylglucosaminyltransferase [Polaribacter septentrionalilitoris]
MIKKYIITVHTNPNHLKRLINKLNDKNSEFYIHLDLKSEINHFKKIVKLPNVVFIEKRVKCIWGDISQVMATINLLKRAIHNKKENSIIIFLSGQDYPIKSLSFIDKYIQENNKNEFIDMMPFKNSIIYNQRVNQYKINNSEKRMDFVYLSPILSSGLKNFKLFIKLILKKKIDIIEALRFVKRKRVSIFKKHYKGSNWFALQYDTVREVLNYIEVNENKLFKYYKYTACADEQFFHTILNEISSRKKTLNFSSSLHFVDWNRKNVPLPVTFTVDDINLLLNQPKGKLFARKFNEDDELLNLLDLKLN